MGHANDRGREYRLRHMVYHRLSPFELSVGRTLLQLSKTIPLRLKRNFWFVPTWGGALLAVEIMDRMNAKTHRKNPKDFENDV